MAVLSIRAMGVIPMKQKSLPVKCKDGHDMSSLALLVYKTQKTNGYHSLNFLSKIPNQQRERRKEAVINA